MSPTPEESHGHRFSVLPIPNHLMMLMFISIDLFVSPGQNNDDCFSGGHGDGYDVSTDFRMMIISLK